MIRPLHLSPPCLGAPICSSQRASFPLSRICSSRIHGILHQSRPFQFSRCAAYAKRRSEPRSRLCSSFGSAANASRVKSFFNVEPPILENHGQNVTPAYVEQVRGAPRRLFFRRHFKFQISNLKFLSVLRSVAIGLPVSRCTFTQLDVLRLTAMISDFIEAFRLLLFVFLSSLITPALQSGLISDSSARHQEHRSPNGAGMFLFCRVRTKGPVSSLGRFHYISTHSSLLPKPSRERSKEATTCKEVPFVQSFSIPLA